VKRLEGEFAFANLAFRQYIACDVSEFEHDNYDLAFTLQRERQRLDLTFRGVFVY
jgi:hypothetical protein